MVQKVIVPVAKTTIENRDTTMTIIYFFQQIGLAWSQSLYKKIIQGFNALYNFFVGIVSTEIAKHQFSIYVDITNFCIRKYA
jgi:hypothetical protein